MTAPRRRLLLSLALLLAAGPAVAAAPTLPGLSETDAQDVARAVSYLEGLTTAKWRFTQTDTRGGRLSGTLILQKPGRARFDYDPPSGMVVASDGHRVAIVDRRLKTIRAYPLGMTPLGLFLGRNIRFDRGVKVAGVERDAEGLTIVAVEARRRDRGSIALNFSASPFSLTGWTLTDGRGVKVQVRLSDFSKIGAQDPKTFELADPAPPPETGGIR